MIKEKLSHLFFHILSFLTPVRVIVFTACFLFLWFLTFGDQGVQKLWKLVEMKNDLTSQRQELSRKIDALNDEKDVLSDPQNLEMVIRKELGYIKPGEVIFETKTAEKK
jgi:cell division protein FtsB